MKQLTVGILAHVDAGKTTLSEAMLYTSGAIRKLGRVDSKNAYLDNFLLERERGITIFSKQAVMALKSTKLTLLDTPGHIDFSAEMERTLQVLDFAVLVVSAADGIQGHTRTLWRLLSQYHIPVFLFINKMDQPVREKKEMLSEIQDSFGHGFVEFSHTDLSSFYEDIAVCSESILESYLDHGKIEDAKIAQLVMERKVFPCYFGSALKLDGITELLNGIERFTVEKKYPKEFGAKVFKIARDDSANRLTYLKITGGSLKVKTQISDEKINQIRIYSGEKFETLQEVNAGTICAVTGLSKTHPGESLGNEKLSYLPILEPILSYKIGLPKDMDASQVLPKLKQLEEEEPQLHIEYKEELKEIHAKLMGEVQTEILQSMILERFGIPVTFEQGTIVYKETIVDTVEGVGHFEPLRHYAEVHLLLEPGEPGSGLQFSAKCSEDILDKNWQRLILTHLNEKEHVGVLTGSAITDMKITLVSGRAQLKHTEGGDFRQATYRALRQGLMEAKSRLLEPVYEYRLEVPENLVGKAMTDIDKMYGKFTLSQEKKGVAILIGTAPVATMRSYARNVIAYTSGQGKFTCELKGYEPCHNEDEILSERPYDPESDLDNPTGSVFCAHGAGFIVPWFQVSQYMHMDYTLDNMNHSDSASMKQERITLEKKTFDHTIDLEEIDEILNRTFYSNKKDSFIAHKGISANRIAANRLKKAPDTALREYRPIERKESHLLVDGYNVIFAWNDLKELAAINIDGARGKLMDVLSNYQAIKGCELILVFDAYRIQGHKTEIMDYHNIHVVYTKEAETADQYIERFAHENAQKYDITVATSDGLEQIIIRGKGCQLISSREFEEEIRQTLQSFREKYL